LKAMSVAGVELGSVTVSLPAKNLLGNIAVVSNYEGPSKRNQNAGCRFSEWKAGGDAFTVSEEQRFGPLLWSMYTLSDSRGAKGFELTLSALTGPLGADDNHSLVLHAKRNGKWKAAGGATLDRDAWTATWSIKMWDATVETPYKVVLAEKHKDGSQTDHEWTGVIKANPSGRPLRLGALTCQNDYAFPYAPVAENVVKLAPDMLYFSGDQIYESHGGFGIIRDPAEPAILNYLRKYYQFGWAFREAMRDRPTVCLPDDHDVFQGNIWGEGGAAMKNLAKGASSKGGYREPARMVNAVHRTTTAHHPPAFDPNPSKQDISVYYGDLVYGNVSFAILGDRQWKSGPERVDTGSGRADHVTDPNFDTSKLDKPDLVLLGERQEEFLRQWAKDWRGHTMKVLLSQTVFAGVATHHGRGGRGKYLKADLDSGAWPQTPRDNAIRILRESMALHINGDQHLTTLSQYGVDAQRDSNWSFCTPAIAVGYPRFWLPDSIGMPHQNRPAHGQDNTGEYLDGCGNEIYVYAVGNPQPASLKHRYKLAQQKGSGFGLVTIDPVAKTYHIDSFRFLIDATDGKASNQFPGWPVTIHQAENRGENKLH
jgi:alkaline phosphatase D